MDTQETMEKGADSEMKHGIGEEKNWEGGEKGVVKAMATEQIDWKEKDGDCATLLKHMPKMDKWEIELIWQVIEDARTDPEEMDIEKLYARATSIGGRWSSQ